MENLNEKLIVLFHAAIIGRTDVIKNVLSSLKLEHNMDEDQIAQFISKGRPEDNASPLHIAANFGHSDVIRTLLNSGADASVATATGEYRDKKPYEVASDSTKQVFHVYMFEQIAMGNSKNISNLIEGGIPVDLIDDFEHRDTLIHWACSFDNIEVVKLLISYGANVNFQNILNQTPLHVACKNNNFDLVFLLLSEGADINLEDNDGKKPFDFATKDHSNQKLFDLLKSPPAPTFEYRNIFLDKNSNINKNKSLSLERNQPNDGLNHPNSTEKQQQDLFTRERPSSLPGTFDASLDCFEESTSPDKIGEESDIFLIFWPPVKYQQRSLPTTYLTLKNNENLQICVSSNDIDIFPLLTWSGLMDVMDLYGFQVQVKRSPLDSKIRLSINKEICPVPNSYEIRVDSHQAVIIAADKNGLLYGVYKLIQLIHLHSKVDKFDGTKSQPISTLSVASGKIATLANDPNNQEQTNIISLSIPSIHISDCPDINSRGVLWSYRNDVKVKPNKMREEIELLSKFHINTLFLMVDPITDLSAQHTEGNLDSHRSDNGESKRPSQEIEQNSDAKIYVFDDFCQRHCIDLVPTIVISSIHDRLPVDELKNFSFSLFNLVFQLDLSKIKSEILIQSGEKNFDSDELNQRSIEEYVSLCQILFKDALEAGFHSILISCSSWIHHIVDPTGIALSLGLSVTEKRDSILFPRSLFTKPIIATQDFICSIKNYISKVQLEGSSFSSLPLFSDRDFSFPSVILKYYSFMYAGYSWNQMAMEDMLGDPNNEDSFDAKIISDVLRLLLFSFKKEISKEAFQILFAVMTGEYCKKELQDHLDSSSTIDKGDSSTNLAELNSSGFHFKVFELSIAEKQLWSVFSIDDISKYNSIPSKFECSLLLKLYKRIIFLSKWKPNKFLQIPTHDQPSLLSFMGFGAFEKTTDVATESTSSIKLEFEEFFTVVNMMSVLSKALAMGYRSHFKGEQNFNINYTQSYHGILETLSNSSKSDLANSILESLKSSSKIWNLKFEHQLIQSLKKSSLLYDRNSNGYIVNRPNPSRDKQSLVLFSLGKSNQLFLLQNTPVVPLSALFKVLTDNLELPKSVEEFILKLFSQDD